MASHSNKTRAAVLDDIFFLGQSLYDENIAEVAKEMVRRYKEQDRAAKRVVIYCKVLIQTST